MLIGSGSMNIDGLDAQGNITPVFINGKKAWLPLRLCYYGRCFNPHLEAQLLKLSQQNHHSLARCD